MTQTELNRIVYVNESRKKRKEKAIQNRREWTGIRNTVFKNKKAYNRQRMKKELKMTIM